MTWPWEAGCKKYADCFIGTLQPEYADLFLEAVTSALENPLGCA